MCFSFQSGTLIVTGLLGSSRGDNRHGMGQLTARGTKGNLAKPPSNPDTVLCNSVRDAILQAGGDPDFVRFLLAWCGYTGAHDHFMDKLSPARRKQLTRAYAKDYGSAGRAAYRAYRDGVLKPLHRHTVRSALFHQALLPLA